MICTIYKITCHINKKLYIGFTSLTIDERFAIHIKDAKKPKNSHLHHAIKKYGAENFTIEAIYQSLDRQHTHNVMEAHFIREYDSIANGYNIQSGGEGGEGKPIKVYQYSRTLELIKIWDSVKEAAAEIQVSSAQISTVMNNAEKGKGSSLKGFVWCRAGVTPVLKKGSNFIEQLDENRHLVKRHHSLASAARGVSGTGSGISAGIKNPYQRWYGFYWQIIICQ